MVLDLETLLTVSMRFSAFDFTPIPVAFGDEAGRAVLGAVRSAVVAKPRTSTQVGHAITDRVSRRAVGNWRNVVEYALELLWATDAQVFVDADAQERRWRSGDVSPETAPARAARLQELSSDDA